MTSLMARRLSRRNEETKCGNMINDINRVLVHRSTPNCIKINTKRIFWPLATSRRIFALGKTNRKLEIYHIFEGTAEDGVRCSLLFAEFQGLNKTDRLCLEYGCTMWTQ
jgi:hypothetical protein